MENIEDGELVVSGNTQNSLVIGSKLLLITMVVLALQDLNLERHFKSLKRYFTISKKEKREVANMVSAFEYLFGKDEDSALGFENFCFVFKIEPGLFRTLILDYIKLDRGVAWTEYLIWREENGI